LSHPVYTYLFILLKNDTGDKSNEKQVRSETQKAQEALTAASKNNNKSTNRVKTVSEAFHKLVKSTLDLPVA